MGVPGLWLAVRLDPLVLVELKRMYRQGYARASVKQLMKRIGRGPYEDSVDFLGALLRMTPAYRRWVNREARCETH